MRTLGEGMNRDEIKAEQERVKKLLTKQRGGRTRGRKDGMNKLERAYAEHLAALQLAGDVEWWGFERIQFKLADRCWWTPDFVVRWAGDPQLEVVDTKGHLEGDAAVKLRVFADQFPTFRLSIARLVRGQWEIEERA